MKQIGSEGLHKLRLSHTRGSRENKGYRFALIGDPGTVPLDGTHDGIHRRILSDDSFFQTVAEPGNLLIVKLRNVSGRDPRPNLDHLGKVFYGQRDLFAFSLQGGKTVLVVDFRGSQIRDRLIVRVKSALFLRRRLFQRLPAGRLFPKDGSAPRHIR